MSRTVDINSLSLQVHQQELAHLLAQPVQDQLAIEELRAQCLKESSRIRTAQNLINEANRNRSAAIHSVLDQFIPSFSTQLS